MCGIVGIVNKRANQISKNIFFANNQMKRRGPDDEGFVLFNEKKLDICYGQDTPLNSFKDKKNYYPIKDIRYTFENNYKVALGHRRLSIIDLSSRGHQPMCDQLKRYWLVFNGEIYNFKEIREKLIILGHSFVSNTDSEVVLKSYIEWGEECLQKFNGMFAFSIYDNQKEEIFLARDRVGIKPIYYTFQDNIFIFASDIKTIIASKLYKPEVNWEGLYHNFSFSIAPRPMTAFKNVYALKQAHFMKIDCKTLQFNETEYWDIPTNVQDHSMTENQAIELLEEELKKSIKYRLIADVDVATFMSGGIDSTTISAMASKVHPNIKAFTLAFDKSITKYDELEEAKATAIMNNMQHIYLKLKPDSIIENINNMVSCYEEPYHHLSPPYMLAKLVNHHGIKVVLNGLGGDELFAGYTLYSRINKWKKITKLYPLFKLLPDNLHPKLKILKKFSKAQNIYQYYATSYSTFDDDEKIKLFKQKFDSLNAIYNQYKKQNKKFSDELELLSYLDIKSYIGSHHVHRMDQFTMHFSIEGRFPFLDHNLIEKSFTIPSKYKINHGMQKYVLRKVAEKYISPKCLNMKKKGFGIPIDYWFNNQLKELVMDSIARLKKRDLINSSGIDNIIKYGNINQKWHLVMFELWYRKFIEKDFIH